MVLIFSILADVRQYFSEIPQIVNPREFVGSFVSLMGEEFRLLRFRGESIRAKQALLFASAISLAFLRAVICSVIWRYCLVELSRASIIVWWAVLHWKKDTTV